MAKIKWVEDGVKKERSFDNDTDAKQFKDGLKARRSCTDIKAEW